MIMKARATDVNLRRAETAMSTISAFNKCDFEVATG
jgi:hypothetical protein